MFKLYLRIDFVKIVFQQKTKQPQKLIFTLEQNNEDRQRINFHLPVDQDTIQLNKISHLQLYIVVNQESKSYAPFELRFCVKGSEQVQRKIHLHKDKFYQYYLKHKKDEKIAALDLVYAFHDGKLIYNVSVLAFEPIINEQEMQKYEEIFECPISKSMRKQQLPDSPELLKNQSSLYISTRRQNKKKELQVKKIQEQQQQDNLDNRDSKMSHETYITLDEDTEFLFSEDNHQSEEILAINTKIKMMHGQNYGRSLTLEEEERKLSKRLSYKIQCVILLVIIGLSLLLVDLIGTYDAVDMDMIVPPKSVKPQKKGKKSRSKRIQKVK